MALGFNKFLGNQGANFNCRPSNIVVNCISIYIMVILDNSRTLGAFERQSRISTYTLNENIANTNPIIHISQWKPISNT